MGRLRAAQRDERGETLVELVVAIAILGIGAVAIMAGLFVSVKSSDLHRKEATGGAYVRSFAEAIQNSIDASGGYKSCANAPSAYAAVPVPTLPSGYVPAVTEVKSWTGSAWGACAPGGIQRVTLTVTSPGDAKNKATETLVVVLRRPCNGSATAVGADPCA